MGRIFEVRKHTMFARWDRMAKQFARVAKDINMAVKAGGADALTDAVRRADAAFCLSMKMNRPALIAQPNRGMLASCFFAMNRNDAGMATNITQMSTIDAWLGMNT